MGIIERVRELIAESGLSQGQFGERSGIDQSKLSKSLSGVRKFTSLEIARIAEDTGVGVDWLLTGRQDEFAAAARTGSKGVSATGALQTVRDYIRMRAGLRDFGIVRDWRLGRRSGTGGRLFVEQGLAMAREVRSELGIEPHAHEDLAALIEEEFQVDVVVQQLDGLDGIAAATPSARIIVASPSVAPARQRFTLMHELAHLLASDDQQLHQDRDVYAKGGKGEMRANAFAAEMLMPEAVLRERATGDRDSMWFERLVWDLRVSPQALAWHLYSCKLVTEAQKDEWLSRRGRECATRIGHGAEYQRRVASSLQQRLPALLIEDMFTAYFDGHITLRPVANLLGVESASLREQLQETVIV